MAYKQKKWHWIIIAFLILICFYAAWISKASFYTERHAKEIASVEFKKYCVEMKEDAASFEGPKRIKMGGATWAFEWKSEKTHRLVGIWLDSSGWPTVYAGDN